ncbi:MAG: hypothetical protein EOP84_00470 [Verrucomicrobiaceae bacterium]|nr:MAG: hypothetical protein EOP84_00470 [Verrucomicrobiaceae bacterium]
MAYANIHDTRRLPPPVRYILDLIAYRHLCWNLVASDLRSRFRRSFLGIVWAIIQPLSFALMIGIVWGSILQSGDYWTFAIYVFSGLIVWEYFATVVNISQDSLINADGYLKQTRIPFLIFQLRVPLGGMIIFLCGFAGLIVFGGMLNRLPPLGPHLLLVPIFLLLLLMFAIPLAVLMSILGALFRDVKYISQIGVQALFFISPVMLERGVFERPELQFLKYANPAVSLLDLFRVPVLYGEFWHVDSLMALLAWISALWLLAALAAVKAGRRIVFAL